MKLEQNSIKTLNDLKRKCDSLAYRVGVLTIEYDQNKKRIQDEISELNANQKLLGETALKSFGLDIEKNDYSIQDDGTIKILKAGVYVDIKG